MKNEKEYVFKYDLMRFVFIMMTLGVHVVSLSIKPVGEDVHYYVRVILNALFLICNPLFFMLSGRLNLAKKFDKKEDYIDYYKKKFISIILPLFIVSIILYFVLYNDFSLLDFLNRFINNEIEPDGTFWFLAPLIGILLLSPFYSKMLQSMSINEKKLFLIICFLINGIITTLRFFNIKSSIGLETVGIISWHFYYFSGYIIEELFKGKKEKNAIYILGVIAFIISILIEFGITHFYKLTDPGILLTFQAFALYLVIFNVKDNKLNCTKNIIRYIASHVYVFYLLHMVITRAVITKIGIYNMELYTFLIYFLIFIITMVLSIIIQKLIIKPIQYILHKMLDLLQEHLTKKNI